MGATGATEATFVALRFEATKPASIVAAVAPPVGTLRLHVRLPNGVELNLNETRLEEFGQVARALSELPCSSSTNR